MKTETDAAGIVNRLRGVYVVPVNDGAGQLGGKDTFTRNFETPPIQHAAADCIEQSLRALRKAEEYLTLELRVNQAAHTEDIVTPAILATVRAAITTIKKS